MKNIITIKNYNDFLKAELNGEFSNKKESIAILTGRKVEDVIKLSQKELIKIENEIAAQVAGKFKEVSMLKYKGKVLGYYPCDIGVLEDMMALEQFGKTQNLQAMAALMFRPCTGWTSFMNRRKWGMSHGIKAKGITNFVKDFTKYKCKPIEDFSRIDLEFYNDFPISILFSAMSFSIGVGAHSILNSLNSQKATMQTQVKIQELIVGSQLRNTLRNTEKIYSNLKELPESNHSLLDQLFSGYKSKDLDRKLKKQAKDLQSDFIYTDQITKAMDLMNEITAENLYNFNLFMFEEKELRKQSMKLWLNIK